MEWSVFAEDRAKRRARIPQWLAAAESDNVDAQLTLAWEYARGEVVDLDIATAWHWFDRAAASNRDEALVNRARFLQLRRVPEGVRELRRLALRGNWKAQFWLAQHYQSRAGRLNQLRAVVWFDRSFKSGNRVANLAKLGQLRRIARLPSKVVFMCEGIIEVIATVWLMTRQQSELELYEPLLYHLKKRRE